MSVLERCPSYRESNKGSKKRQGPTLGVRFTKVAVLYRCPLRESRLYSHDAEVHARIASCVLSYYHTYDTPKENEVKFKPRIGTNHNTYT